jgi:hypothetical protein
MCAMCKKSPESVSCNPVGKLNSSRLGLIHATSNIDPPSFIINEVEHVVCKSRDKEVSWCKSTSTEGKL